MPHALSHSSHERRKEGACVADKAIILPCDQDFNLIFGKRSRTLFIGILRTVCLVAPSCGNPGGARYHVTGKVTFDGKPIPIGKIYFHSNVPRGNAGPPAFAEIQEGVYDTRTGGSGVREGQSSLPSKGSMARPAPQIRWGSPCSLLIG